MSGIELPGLRNTETPVGPVLWRGWDGPGDVPFVLVHGLGGSQLNWVQVAPSLAGLGPVIAPDLPGFGRTPLVRRPAGIMDLRRALDGFLRVEAPGPVVLAGNSMGGVLAVLQAAIEPERVAGLILSGSAFPRSGAAVPNPIVMAGFGVTEIPRLGEAAVRARLTRLRPDRVVRLGFRMVTVDPRSIPPEVVQLHEELIADQRTRPDVPEAFIQASRSLLRLARHHDAARRALDAVRCPVLVVHGRRDRFVPARFAEAELARHPAWRGRILPGVGHVPQMESPGRWIAEVADWHAANLP